MQNKRLILASGSPRRQQLLKDMGYTFEVIVPNVDEHAEGTVESVVKELSIRKAAAVAKQLRDGIIIASDTLVSLDGIALGKPNDAEEAYRMLRSLSGRTHEVFTGVTVIDAEKKDAKTIAVRTGVVFRELNDNEINAYIATGEPMDKAGAYAIQGGAGAFISKFEGSFENVVGFPVEEIREILIDMNV